MTQNLLFSLSTLAALIPLTFHGLARFDGREGARDGLYWTFMGVAVAIPLAWAVFQVSGVWQTGLSTTLWVTVAVSMSLFFLIAAVTRQAWRLTSLMAPYMLGLGVLATIWQHAPPKPLRIPLDAWLEVHIAVSVLTYGLVTIAAVAALAATLQDRALKSKKPTRLTARLPSIADCEFLLVRLLAIGEGVLALGLSTGMASLYLESGRLITFDHKTILTMTAFLVIGALLFAHYRSGVRGRQTARIVLLAYLLMTLGYPGVKFVTDVLMT
jgi:ABC-type uncharacterized transport system permease subunit